MFFTLGLILLFFLPVIESFDRNLAFNLLMIGSLMVSLSTFRRVKLSFDFIELLWLLMLLTFTLSTTLSWSISRSYLELLRYFAYFLIFVSVRRFPNVQHLFKRFFLPMIIVNSIILSLLSIIYALPIFKLSPPTNGMNLFYPVFGHSHLSDLLIFTLPIMISLVNTANQKYIRRVLIMGGSVLTVIFILTMARGAMLSLVFALFIYFLCIKRDKRWYPWIFLISSITVIFLLASFIFSNFLVSPEKGKQFPKFIYKNVASENRPIYFQQALNNFIANPIFGSGLDTFRYVSRMYQDKPFSWSWYAHNHYLQLFTETGFLGGVAFVVIIVSLIIYSFNNIRYKDYNSYNSGLLIAVLASSIHSLIDFDWQFLSIFLIFWMSAALLMPKTEEEGKNKNFLWFSLVVIVSALYSLQLVIPLDSEKLLAKDDIASVLQAYRLDTKNIDIVKKIAQLEANDQNFNKAHYWYRMAIFLAPSEAFNSIKQDSLLYLSQIKKAVTDKNINLSLTYLKNLAETYPFYFQISGGDYYLVNAYKMNNLKDKSKALQFLKEYSTVTQRKLSSYRLSPLEIQSIIDNLHKMKTIY